MYVRCKRQSITCNQSIIWCVVFMSKAFSVTINRLQSTNRGTCSVELYTCTCMHTHSSRAMSVNCRFIARPTECEQRAVRVSWGKSRTQQRLHGQALGKEDTLFRSFPDAVCHPNEVQTIRTHAWYESENIDILQNKLYGTSHTTAGWSSENAGFPNTVLTDPSGSNKQLATFVCRRKGPTRC